MRNGLTSQRLNKEVTRVFFGLIFCCEGQVTLLLHHHDFQMILHNIEGWPDPVVRIPDTYTLYIHVYKWNIREFNKNTAFKIWN